MTPDFPAAHSMDTTWYAVDRCGHVALFASGEEGAVPEGAPDAYPLMGIRRPFPTELERCLRSDNLRLGRHDTEVTSATMSTWDPTHSHVVDTSYDYGYGFFLLGPGAFPDLWMIRAPVTKHPVKWSPEAPVLGKTDGYDWVEGNMHPDSWNWLHASPDRCRGCARWLDLGLDRRAEMYRIIKYHSKDYGNQPYERSLDASPPVTLEELRKLVQQPLPEAPRFTEFCFRDKSLIQPLQWLPSRTYKFESDWIHEDGRRLRHDGSAASDDPDFPAAHSMDTHWFAVDKCGHVAAFDSGEDGCVPEDAPDLYASLADGVPFPGELDRAFRERWVIPGDHTSKTGNDTVRYVTAFYLLGPGLKANPARVRGPEKDPAEPWVRDPVFGTTDGRDWVDGALSWESWAWMHEMPHRCLGCTSGFHVDFDQRAEAFGILRYDCSNYGLHPYVRILNPSVPTTVQEIEKVMGRPLPPAPRFDQFCFRDKRLLQPLQWLPCRTWGSREEWVDEDGNQRKSESPEA
jgi:hypothetical protein